MFTLCTLDYKNIIFLLNVSSNRNLFCYLFYHNVSIYFTRILFILLPCMALYMNYIVVIDYLYRIYSVLTRKHQPSSKLKQKDCTEPQVLLTRFSYYTYKQNNMNIF